MNTSKLLDLLHPGKYSGFVIQTFPAVGQFGIRPRLVREVKFFCPFKVLSVWKVVPTLTSTSAEIYLWMAGAKQHNDMGFILVPAVGRTFSRGALEALYCVAP
jgi:hypothetical protein